MAIKVLSKKGKKKHKKTILTPFEKEKKNHRDEIRNMFINSGFNRISGIEDKEFTFNGRVADIDDVFIFENIVILAEYTCSASGNISDHLLKKKVIFDHIINYPEEFIEYFDSKFSSFKEGRNSIFDNSQIKIIIIYASKNSISSQHKDQVPGIIFLDYHILKYFTDVTKAIKLSAKHEILKFLGLNSNDIGIEGIQNLRSNEVVKGTILPESFSNFPKGYKVVSFYISPNSLLRKSYVLRKDGWRLDSGLYQRMISKSKINQIRKYLYTEKRVFINNLIVTLPSETKLLDEKGNTIDPAHITVTKPVDIQINNSFDTIGLIDGQHRVYAYHEGGSNDAEIRKLRDKQNLLVTGLIYPDNIQEKEKNIFEAGLFLEINSSQTKPRKDLKQHINLVLAPFSTESIAMAVLHRMNINGPLESSFERYIYDKDKIKTTSIVSYGLNPIVKLSGEDSFFKIWSDPNKDLLRENRNNTLLDSYIDFCTSNLNIFLGAAKTNIESSRWSFNKSTTNRVLSVTSINAFIKCLRLIINNNISIDFESLKTKLNGLDSFSFDLYKSSQYNAMGEEIYKKFFSNYVP